MNNFEKYELLREYCWPELFDQLAANNPSRVRPGCPELQIEPTVDIWDIKELHRAIDQLWETLPIIKVWGHVALIPQSDSLELPTDFSEAE